MEKWTPITEFPKHSISSEGRVKNVATGRILKPGKNPKGYDIVSLYKDGEQCTKKVHRLVAEAFLNRDVYEHEVNHKDGNKNNNSMNNLEWCTGSYDITHAYNRGLRKPPRMKRVKIVETGETFDSFSDCARYIHGTVSGIHDCETGRQTSHRGYRFEFI